MSNKSVKMCDQCKRLDTSSEREPGWISLCGSLTRYIGKNKSGATHTTLSTGMGSTLDFCGIDCLLRKLGIAVGGLEQPKALPRPKRKG